jgi:hypothetical protein
MATEAASGLGMTNGVGAGFSLGREAAGWLQSRLTEGALGPAVFLVEADERFYRVRRVLGEVHSCFEARLGAQASTQEVAQAVARHAQALGVTVKVRHELGGASRVSVGSSLRGD